MILSLLFANIRERNVKLAMTWIFLETKPRFRLLQSRSDFYHKMATFMVAVLKFN